MKIILIGYMGSGKSSIGRRLAHALNFESLDLDSILEKSETKSIQKIFKESGEIYFRKQESLLLREVISNKNNFVLATGGGTPCYGNIMEFLKTEKNLVTIYLNTTVDVLTKRLFIEKEQRPLISHLQTEEVLNEFIRKHLFERAFYYNQSSIRLDTHDLSEQAVTERIIASLY